MEQKSKDIKLESLETLKDIADLLNVKVKRLGIVLYSERDNRASQYKEYSIKKKNGGTREISAPEVGLKILQKNLAKVLLERYQIRPSAHAFLPNTSIITNAKRHLKHRHIFNIDLKDFFPSINFGRVRGLFMAKPYNMNAKTATVFAQIACYKNSIPQGAPTSPIISNMICSKLDGELQKFAKENKCTYTRYADDITFSTNQPSFPKEIGFLRGEVSHPSTALKKVIEKNGFTINSQKVRLQSDDDRKIVTGITVNSKLNVSRKYVRNLRTALYKWNQHGIEVVSKEYFEKYIPTSKENSTKRFDKIIRGKLEFLRFVRSSNKKSAHCSKHHPNQGDIFENLILRYFECGLRDHDCTTIRTEGKTDWIIFEAVLKVLQTNNEFKNLKIVFHKIKEDRFYGDQTLSNFCSSAKNLRRFKQRIICIFDHDNDAIKKNHEKGVISWSNNVFSLVIPLPPEHKNSCSTELLFKDDDIRRLVVNGRRLYLSNEFNKDGTLKSNGNIKYQGKIKLDTGEVKVIDSDVFDKSSGKSLALSKNHFAKTVSKSTTLLNCDLMAFRKLFKEIEEFESRMAKEGSKNVETKSPNA